MMWTLIFLTLFFGSTLFLCYMVLEDVVGTWITPKIVARRAARKVLQFDAGYQYAWGAMHHYGDHPEVLNMLRNDLNRAYDTDSYNDFERGMYKAVKEMESNLRTFGKLSPVAH